MGKAESAIRELVASIEPPLRYLATAEPRRLAPNALPVAHFVGLIERALAESAWREPLIRLRDVLEDFPLEDPARRRESAEAGLREVARLRAELPAGEGPPAAMRSEGPEDGARQPVAARVAGTRGGAPAYRRTVGPLDAGLELLSRPAQFVKGVGPRRAAQLARFGLHTVEDVLYHLPFRYEDRRRLVAVRDLRPGETATFVAEIAAIGEKRVGRHGRRMLEALARDASGVVSLVWFHRISWFAGRLEVGSRVVLHGRVEAAYGRRQIVHPEVELLEGEEGELGRVMPVYEKPGEMTVGVMRKIVHAALADAGDRVPSILPEDVAHRLGLLDLATAFREVHDPAPDADADLWNAGRSPAHRSIVFDELFFLQLGMGLRRSAVAAEPGIVFRPAGDLEARFRAGLPFRLTGAQERVAAEIAADMAKPHPMSRLVQGDVGSGKTVVAALAALRAIECGTQAALMAPTEILAEQHHTTLSRWLAPLGVRTALLTGRRPAAERRAAAADVASGAVDLVVGTHALIQESVTFARLGLGIVDEQHRFGVMQRKTLQAAGDASPDVLLMTATPIPRTLAMTLYGDLDLSFLDELPPGRKPVETRVVFERERGRAYERVRAEIDGGRQAYLVFPLVEDSEKTTLRSAKAMAKELAEGPLRGYRVALLHGQMKSEEKDAVMRRFQAGDHQALVATTVIEVGVDVPNATVMMVDHAEQFGLAQLHQLRGRVGRGADRSYCFLVASAPPGSPGLERLRLLERETDGSRVAEADLRLRGPGELLGLRQSGLGDFRVANLVRDLDVLERARREAEALLVRDPGLASEASAPLRRVLAHRWQGRLGLARVG